MAQKLQNFDLFEDEFFEMLIFEFIKGNHLDGDDFFWITFELQVLMLCPL